MENKKNYILIGVLIVVIVGALLVKYFSDRTYNNILTGDTVIGQSLSSKEQAEVDNYLKDELVKNKYTLDRAKVYVNPYNANPLSAMIMFYTDDSTEVSVTVKGKNSDDFTINYGKSNYHYIPVYGLYGDYDNTVVVTLGDKTTKEFRIKTDKIDMPSVTTKSGNITSAGDLYLLTSPISMNSFGLDGYGNVRWMLSDTYYHNIKVLDNGHLLIGIDTDSTSGLPTVIREIDYLGRIYNEYTIDSGYLNDFFVKSNGNIIVTSKNADRITISDLVLEIDKNTGKIVKQIDVYKLFESIDKSFTDGIERDDYFYNSGIEYYEDTDTLLLTYWGGEMVVSIDYSDSKINWIFTNPDNLPSTFDSYLLKGDDGFVYPKAMHQAKLSGDTLKVLDNGYSTIKNETDLSNLKGSYSSVNTYTITDKKIALTNSYNDNKKYFSYALGDLKTVGNGKDIILFGRELDGVDYSKGGSIHEYGNLSSVLLEVTNNKETLNLRIKGAYYSITKVNLNGDVSFDFTTVKGYTTLEASPKEDITSDVISKIASASDEISLDFGYSDNIVTNNALFMDIDEAKMILINDSSDGAVYTIKEKDKSKVDKTVIDLKAGKYYIFIVENDTAYKTNKYIEVK